MSYCNDIEYLSFSKESLRAPVVTPAGAPAARPAARPALRRRDLLRLAGCPKVRFRRALFF
ncbi:MAG: hypothetical protein ACYDC7_00535 [Acidithiobacillus ferrivorans]